jgi:hypothetical protein
MSKRQQPYAFQCMACEDGMMTPTPHGHACNKCRHFENDTRTYSVMERDRGEDYKVCECGWCKSGHTVKNQPSTSRV